LKICGSNFTLKDTSLLVSYKKPFDFIAKSQGCLDWRVAVDEKRTLQPLEIPLLIKIHRKRGMGWLIALDEPCFNKPIKTIKPAESTPYYDYVI